MEDLPRWGPADLTAAVADALTTNLAAVPSREEVQDLGHRLDTARWDIAGRAENEKMQSRLKSVENTLGKQKKPEREPFRPSGGSRGNFHYLL